MNSLAKKWPWYLLGGLLLVVVLYFSLVPRPPVPDLRFSHQDKLYHLICYSFLGHYFAQIIADNKSCFIFLFLYSLFIELLQPYTGRSFELLDLVFNAFGVFLGILMVSKVERLNWLYWFAKTSFKN
jgi:VanZ family protein